MEYYHDFDYLWNLREDSTVYIYTRDGQMLQKLSYSELISNTCFDW